MKEKKMYKLRKVGYSYHPDFIEDPTEPKGYRILDTGRWIVEWDIYRYPVVGLTLKGRHMSRAFLTEEEAKNFENKLIHSVGERGIIQMSRNKKFYLNED